MFHRLVCLAACCALASAASLPIRQSGFTAGPDGLPVGWKTWSPRPEIAPRAFVDPLRHALAINGNSNASEHGGWEYAVAGLEPGAWYRFSARFRSVGVPYAPLQIFSRVAWRTSQGREAAPPDYPWRTEPAGEWTRVTADVQAPEKTASAILQLYLFNAPLGTVWWDDIRFESIPAPAPRPVTIATINLRPQSTKASAESVRQFVEAVEKLAPPKADLILLPEGITVVGTGKSYVDVAETIPGPTTSILGELARKHSSYLVAGIYEREGHTVYNTAVLLDRQGKVAGKYRKVYLPIGEIDGGLTPGNDYPVFRTDFGTIGLMICYDVFFPDPARALARKGAEIILLPIWGGNETLAKARAIDNQIYLVASGYDHPTYIMNPDGERLAQAPQRGTAAIATIDLTKRYLHDNLGDMRARRMKEYRGDVPVE